MSLDKFEPTQYKNKKTIYVNLSNTPGISVIWDWSPRKKKYCRRTIGNKFYGVKRVNGHQTTKCFGSLNEAKKWKQSFDHDLLDDYEGMTFGDLKEKYFQKKKSEVRISTFETYGSKVKHLKFFDHLPVEAITPRLIDAWLSHVKSPVYLKGQHPSRLSYRHELSSCWTFR